MRKLFLACGAVTAALLVALPGAFAQTNGASADPGVTRNTIVLGGTFPLSGPASSYGTIPVGMRAYFSYINSRRGPDKKRGVYGRQIVWKYYDDAYNPANSVQLQRRLVEEDKVFAIVGSLGTEVNQAIRPYLNQRKVPHLFVSTGASFWGTQYKEFPWTIGWQPDYVAEGTVYGRYLRANRPNSKIGILYQNDDYGKDYIAGLEKGLGNRTNLIVERQGYELPGTSLGPQITRLKNSGADVLVLFSTPTPTVVSYATLKALNWKPDLIVLNSVSATDLVLAAASARAGQDTLNGSISTSYLKDPANPKWDNDAGMKLYKQLMERFAPANAKVADVFYLYGMAKAHSTVQLLYAAGRNPTRASLMRAVQRINDRRNPFLLPGVVTKTSATDRFPISQVKLIRYNNGTWNEFGGLTSGR